MSDIPINLAVEDDLSETVLKAILRQSQRPFSVGVCLKKQGYGYIKTILPGLNKAAQGSVYLVLTDLDNKSCPMEILTSWLPGPKHPNLIFRIAVREVEAWLLADREAFAQFVGIAHDGMPDNPDQISDPKTFLLSLVKKSKNRQLKNDLLPNRNSTAKVGRNYNAKLTEFVNNDWRINRAKCHSPSLKRAVNAIINFQPLL